MLDGAGVSPMPPMPLVTWPWVCTWTESVARSLGLALPLTTATSHFLPIASNCVIPPSLPPTEL